MANPLGHRLESHTKKLVEGGFCLESITPAQYRGRLGGGGCFFPFFFAPKNKNLCQGGGGLVVEASITY